MPDANWRRNLDFHACNPRVQSGKIFFGVYSSSKVFIDGHQYGRRGMFRADIRKLFGPLAVFSASLYSGVYCFPTPANVPERSFCINDFGTVSTSNFALSTTSKAVDQDFVLPRLSGAAENHAFLILQAIHSLFSGNTDNTNARDNEVACFGRSLPRHSIKCG